MSVDCKPFDAASRTHNVANESIGKFVAIGILNCKKLYALDIFLKVILKVTTVRCINYSIKIIRIILL